MASEDEKVAFSLSDQQTLVPPIAPVALCFALSLFFVLIQNPDSPLAHAIKLANGVIQASSAFKYRNSPSSSPATFFFASKVVIKSFKFSQHLIRHSAAAGPTTPAIAARKLKACVAAVNLLRYARNPPHADMPMGLGFLNIGHKFSKNLLRVVEVFTGLRLDDAFRSSIDALGLLLKAAIVVRVIGERVRTNGWVWRRNSYGFRRVGDLRCGLCLRCKRSCFDRLGIEKRFNCFRDLDFGVNNVTEEELEVSVSELLSLSIPIKHPN